MEEHDQKRNIAKPVAGAVGVAATAASIWWFALRPRMKSKKTRSS